MKFAPIVVAAAVYFLAVLSHYNTKLFEEKYVKLVGKLSNVNYGMGVLAYVYEGDRFNVEVVVGQYDTSDHLNVPLIVKHNDPNTPFPAYPPWFVDKAPLLVFAGTALLCLQILVVIVSLKPIDTSIDSDLIAYVAIAEGLKAAGGAKTSFEYDMVDQLSKFAVEMLARDELTMKQGVHVSELMARLSKLKGKC